MGVGEVKGGGGVEAKEAGGAPCREMQRVMDGEEGCIPWHLVRWQRGRRHRASATTASFSVAPGKPASAEEASTRRSSGVESSSSPLHVLYCELEGERVWPNGGSACGRSEITGEASASTVRVRKWASAATSAPIMRCPGATPPTSSGDIGEWESGWRLIHQRKWRRRATHEGSTVWAAA
jgi:hypothetical protein